MDSSQFLVCQLQVEPDVLSLAVDYQAENGLEVRMALIFHSARKIILIRCWHKFQGFPVIVREGEMDLPAHPLHRDSVENRKAETGYFCTIAIRLPF